MFELAIAKAIVRAVAESAPQTAGSICDDARKSGISPDRCKDVIGKLVHVGVLTDNGQLTVDQARAVEMGLL